MLSLLVGLSLSAHAGSYVLSTGKTVEVGDRGNWARLVHRLDGGYWFFVAGSGDYWVEGLSDDLELEGGRRGLTGEDTLVDHALTHCPDGSFLHIASANLDSLDDSAYAFRYDSDLTLVSSGTIAERDPTTAYNDAPALCTGDFDGSPFQPYDNKTGYFIQIDNTIDVVDQFSFDGLPAVGGGSLVEEDSGQIVFIRAWYQDNELLIETYDDPKTYTIGEWKLRDWQSTPVVDDGLTVYWPQSTVRIGDVWVVAFMARDDTLTWNTDSGNVYLGFFNRTWELQETYEVTGYKGGQGAMQPFLTWDRGTDRLLVAYSVNVQPTITELFLDIDAMGVTLRENTPPVAEAGPDQRVRLGNTAYLDGSSSVDDDGDELTYQWTISHLADGSKLSVDGITIDDVATAHFVPDVTGDFVVELQVDDGRDADTDTVSIEVFDEGGDDTGATTDGGSTDGGGSDSGDIPATTLVVDAGPARSATVGEPVMLDGTGSSSTAGPLSYSWSLLSAPEGSAITSGDITDATTSQAQVTPDVEGSFTFQLSASDGTESGTDTVEVTATADGKGSGCGCDGGASGAAALWFLLPLIGLRRRQD